MNNLKELNLWENLFESDKIPEIDLYMDQVLSLIEEKGITKTMINNYSKERLIKPVKGKKYTKEQIIQILFILNMKHNIALNEIKALMPQDEGAVDFEKVYKKCMQADERLEKAIVRFAQEEITAEDDLTQEEQALAMAMMLSSCSKYFTNVCKSLVNEADVQNMK